MFGSVCLAHMALCHVTSRGFECVLYYIQMGVLWCVRVCVCFVPWQMQACSALEWFTIMSVHAEDGTMQEEAHGNSQHMHLFEGLISLWMKCPVMENMCCLGKSKPFTHRIVWHTDTCEVVWSDHDRSKGQVSSGMRVTGYPSAMPLEDRKEMVKADDRCEMIWKRKGKWQCTPGREDQHMSTEWKSCQSVCLGRLYLDSTHERTTHGLIFSPPSAHGWQLVGEDLWAILRIFLGHSYRFLPWGFILVLYPETYSYVSPKRSGRELAWGTQLQHSPKFTPSLCTCLTFIFNKNGFSQTANKAGIIWCWGSLSFWL